MKTVAGVHHSDLSRISDFDYSDFADGDASFNPGT